MDIAEQVKALLEERFPGAAVDIEIITYSQKVSGHLIWGGFDGVEQIDRQDWVIGWLRQRLGPKAASVSTILTYSTNEYQVMSLV